MADEFEITGYMVQEAVEHYITGNRLKCGDKLHFDSESSMFNVNSKDYAALLSIVRILIRLATDTSSFTSPCALRFEVVYPRIRVRCGSPALSGKLQLGQERLPFCDFRSVIFMAGGL